VKWPHAVAAVVIVFLGAGCTTNTRTTGQVDSVAAGRICFTPENNDQTDLNGCWPIGAADAAGIEQSDCIEARIPRSPDDPVTGVRKLQRACHVGVEPHTSTGAAVESVILLVAVSAAIVYFGAVLPRQRRKRQAAPPKASAPVSHEPTADPDEVTIVPVVEGDGDPDPPHRRRK
jgi:hypothetical protein